MNLDRDFPSIPSTNKGKKQQKSSNQPHAAPKSYAHAAAPRAPTFAQTYSSVSTSKPVEFQELQDENKRLKEKVRELEKANAELNDQLEARDLNMSCLNNSAVSLFSMISSIMTHLKLPQTHHAMRELRRNGFLADECKMFQKELDTESFTESESEAPNASVPPAHSSSTLHAKQSSLSARRNSHQADSAVHFAGQKRDLSPNSKSAINQKRFPLLEDDSNNMDVDSTTVTQHSGALSIIEAPGMQ